MKGSALEDSWEKDRGVSNTNLKDRVAELRKLARDAGENRDEQLGFGYVAGDNDEDDGHDGGGLDGNVRLNARPDRDRNELLEFRNGKRIGRKEK